ncbi:10398_t:CDS:2 [Funneliformis mosseae]|uniref:10398_t:CDS:1 n=1 Tax=Funneliformis mosseae TaxID=27381 RepID=A0A9N8YNW7_FUNMO|nr:10398_t:CDS:2 [Funneliformis mosseae]
MLYKRKKQKKSTLRVFQTAWLEKLTGLISCNKFSRNPLEQFSIQRGIARNDYQGDSI